MGLHIDNYKLLSELSGMSMTYLLTQTNDAKSFKGDRPSPNTKGIGGAKLENNSISFIFRFPEINNKYIPEKIKSKLIEDRDKANNLLQKYAINVSKTSSSSHSVLSKLCGDDREFYRQYCQRKVIFDDNKIKYASEVDLEKSVEDVVKKSCKRAEKRSSGWYNAGSKTRYYYDLPTDFITTKGENYPYKIYISQSYIHFDSAIKFLEEMKESNLLYLLIEISYLNDYVNKVLKDMDKNVVISKGTLSRVPSSKVYMRVLDNMVLSNDVIEDAVSSVNENIPIKIAVNFSDTKSLQDVIDLSTRCINSQHGYPTNLNYENQNETMITGATFMVKNKNLERFKKVIKLFGGQIKGSITIDKKDFLNHIEREEP